MFKHRFIDCGFLFNKETFFITLAVFAFLAAVLVLNRIIFNFSLPAGYITGTSVGQFLMVALLEEYVYRGFITRKLLDFVIDKPSFIIVAAASAGLFSLAHLPNFFSFSFSGIDAETLIFSFFVGLWLAVYYIHTKNLTVCVLVHGLFNAAYDYSHMYGSDSIIQGAVWVLLILFLCIRIRKSSLLQFRRDS